MTIFYHLVANWRLRDFFNFEPWISKQSNFVNIWTETRKKSQNVGASRLTSWLFTNTEELNLRPSKTNPSSDREEDLNLRPLDYKFRALTWSHYPNSFLSFGTDSCFGLVLLRKQCAQNSGSKKDLGNEGHMHMLWPNLSKTWVYIHSLSPTPSLVKKPKQISIYWCGYFKVAMVI